jgi:RNA recognition motif-containing protein
MATIYVGNLNYRATENDLGTLFSEYGNVESVKMIMDKMTGRVKGFAFVEMPNEEEANRAIEALHNKEFMTRNILVNKARPMEKKF